MERRFGLSRAEWAQRVLASVWVRLLARFDEGMTDDEARDLADAMKIVSAAKRELLEEAESGRAAWRDGA
jgi:hypothetical protein